jgi:hypothetical protein
VAWSNRWSAFNTVRKETGYRSGLEAEIAKDLKGRKASFLYEPKRLYYVHRTHYTPDFILRKQAIIIEAKGEFTSADRKKMRLVKEQYPDLDIRMVFSNPNTLIGKKSKTTYAMWCERHGFPYAKGRIPEEWLKHKPKAKQKKALEAWLDGKS